MSRSASLTMFLAAAILARPAFAESIDGVEKKIAEQSAKLKSWSAKMKSVTEIAGEGYKTKTVSEGTFEQMRKGDVVMFRSETNTTTTMDIAGKPTKMESKATSISDGQFVYTLTDTSGMKNAMKMKAQKQVESAPFKTLREDYILMLLPEETIDGRKAYVIEAKPRPGRPASAGVGRMVYYYDQSTGISLKTVSNDASGKPTVTTTYTDIKIDPSLSPDRFVFKAPAGVQVQDLTKGE